MEHARGKNAGHANREGDRWPFYIFDIAASDAEHRNHHHPRGCRGNGDGQAVEKNCETVVVLGVKSGGGGD